jgi:hypothetical protein
MHHVVQYRVHPDRAEENEALVRDVYAELDELAPAGLQYATYVLPDGVSFVHVAAHRGEGPSPLTSVPAFGRFQLGIAERCADGPHVRPARRLGAYGSDA